MRVPLPVLYARNSIRTRKVYGNTLPSFITKKCWIVSLDFTSNHSSRDVILLARGNWLPFIMDKIIVQTIYTFQNKLNQDNHSE